MVNMYFVLTKRTHPVKLDDSGKVHYVRNV